MTTLYTDNTDLIVDLHNQLIDLKSDYEALQANHKEKCLEASCLIESYATVVDKLENLQKDNEKLKEAFKLMLRAYQSVLKRHNELNRPEIEHSEAWLEKAGLSTSKQEGK